MKDDENIKKFQKRKNVYKIIKCCERKNEYGYHRI